MTVRVDLNADLGELPGQRGAAIDRDLLGVVTSANVACGGHAGDLASMRRVASLAARNGVSIGAHLSYPDREHFGRRNLGFAPADLLASLRSQLEDLLTAASDAGTAVRYIKAHGALYNASVVGDAAASLLVEVASEYGLPVLTQHDGRLAACAHSAGLGVYGEFFADRAYEADGTLRPRDLPAAVITDHQSVVGRVLTAVSQRTVVSQDGAVLAVRVDSVCLHGDTAGAVELARRVRDALQEHPAVLAPFVDPAP